MLTFVPVDEALRLDDYGAVANLAGMVRDLRTEAATLVPRLAGRTVWMVNSTAQGGGVAEMLPKLVGLLGELGVATRWAVIGSDRPDFFALTKHLHNLIHGRGEARLGPGERELYEDVNQRNADELRPHLKPEDILVVHDPQPMALGAVLARTAGVRAVWRSHIGLDQKLAATQAAWDFLRPYADAYSQAVFSAPEYIPDHLAGRATVIHPSVDPLGHKNRELPPHKLVGILCNAGLVPEQQPVLTPPFAAPVHRLAADGRFVPASATPAIGLLYRPVVTQVSRWDRLKGFGPLLEGFVRLKQRLGDARRQWEPRHRRRIEILRLVLAGPDPTSVQDDPEAVEVVRELAEACRRLPAGLQDDVALLSLPMRSRKENALIVNALQRCAEVVVQNSLREGFGLTATEAMWKRVPVQGTRACGLRQQIRDGIDGILVQNPEDPDEIAAKLDRYLEDVTARDIMARAAQRRVYDEFLVFTHVRQWLRLLTRCAEAPPREPC